MITKIILDNAIKEHFKAEGEDNCLNNLNQLNILIGANNTGKSRFLRTLFTNRNFKLEITELKAREISDLFRIIKDEISSSIDRMGYDDVNSQNIQGVKKTLKKYIVKLQEISVKELDKVANELITFWSWLSSFQANGAINKPNTIPSGDTARASNAIKEIINNHRDALSNLIPETFTYSVERVYIPILRGLRPTQLKDDENFDEIQDNYLKRTVRDYFKDAEIKDDEIFTGLRLYNDTKKMLLGKQVERDKIRRFEAFLSKTFFNDQPFTLIPNIEDDSLHVSIGNEERPIYELGDGIQSIIILLYPLFFNQGKNMMVFIEEPENSMHPGLQRLFLETISQETFKTFQFFISTHSNHFLDITLDLSRISIYTFNKIQNEIDRNSLTIIENASHENMCILDLIGARNSSVFLSNCTIWVEGITDRLYLKKYLELYQESLRIMNGNNSSYKEDFNFSFIEYGGSNITHWTFGDEEVWEKIKASKISTKMLVVADKDSTETKPNSEKAKRLKNLKELLGDQFQIIDGREIENILSPEVLVETIKSLERNNADNIEYKQIMLAQEKYLNKPLGRFIVQQFQNINRKYEAKSGTISCKLDFCRAALEKLKSFDDLSPQAKTLTENIYAFIVTANT